MSVSQGPADQGDRASPFDSLNSELVILEGNEDTTRRPIPPSLRASHEEYRRLVAEWERLKAEKPPEPPPTGAP